jgi:hypothetical protein
MPAMKIMFIRHAEKPESAVQGVSEAGKADAEELVVRGWQRSGVLVHLFAPRDGRFAAPQLARPKTIFASAIGRHSNSLRPQHTVLELSRQLNLSLDLRFPKGDETDLAEAAVAASGPVLIAWEHEDIPAIVNAIVGNATTCPQKWPDARFDLIWILDRQPADAGWEFGQVPQMLLSGDSDQTIAGSQK